MGKLSMPLERIMEEFIACDEDCPRPARQLGQGADILDTFVRSSPKFWADNMNGLYRFGMKRPTWRSILLLLQTWLEVCSDVGHVSIPFLPRHPQRDDFDT